MKMRVVNMYSAKGNKVPNQFILSDDGVEIFQSYDKVIAQNTGGVVTLDRNNWDYSKTTAKYRNWFLNENTKQTQDKIDSGEYTLADLN
jgi:hypothetical protein